MNENHDSKINRKSVHEIDKRHLKNIWKKSKSPKIVRMITYIVDIIGSWLFGAISTGGMGAPYPYANLIFFPAGFFSYILTQIVLGKYVYKYDKSISKVLLYIFTLVGSLASFIFGVYYRLTKVEVYKGVALYGVFLKDKNKNGLD